MLNNRDTNDKRHIFLTFHSPSGTEHITQSNLKLKTTENYLFLFKFALERADHAGLQTTFPLLLPELDG
jgi:hypothetical protein